MPKGYLFEIVSDRGFQGDVMFQMCKELEIDFIILYNLYNESKIVIRIKYSGNVSPLRP